MPELAFELPLDLSNDVAKIVDAIPYDWKGFLGFLGATRELYAHGSIAQNTVLAFDYRGSGIIGLEVAPFEDDLNHSTSRKETNPDLIGIASRNKYFAAAAFRLTDNVEIFRQAKDVAVKFLQLGYKGSIMVDSAFHRGNMHENPLSFRLNHRIQEERAYCPYMPPHISISWEPKFRGNPDGLALVINAIERANLKRLQIPQKN